jgi:tripartite-type tricarboxylate transporter receptor subunit TctC
MKNIITQRALGAIVLGLAFAGAGAAHADAYPDQPIRMIVPFPPGGGTDTVSRVIANELSKQNGWTVVPENKAGSGGSLGLSLAAKARPDGYSIVMAQNANMVINPILGKGNYDPVADFAPVALVASAPQVMVVRKDSPIASVADLLAQAKERPGKVRLATPGVGTSSHLAGELFQQRSGIKLLHVPYKGTGQALPELLGGRVDVYIASVPSAMSHIQEGTLRPLAVFAKKRSADLADVPTLEELGVKDSEAVTWWGVAAPAGTPPAVIELLNTRINALLQQERVRAQLKAAGAEALGGTAAEFAALVKSDVPKWTAVVKAAKLPVAP